MQDVEAKTKEYETNFLNPLIAAQRGFIEDVIIPSTTRQRVIEDLQLLKTKEDNRPWRKHGCGPL